MRLVQVYVFFIFKSLLESRFVADQKGLLLFLHVIAEQRILIAYI